MSQYKNEVAYQKKKLEAEKWAGKVKYLEAKEGYLETAYNSGHITREHSDGSFEVIAEGDSIERIIQRSKTNE